MQHPPCWLWLFLPPYCGIRTDGRTEGRADGRTDPTDVIMAQSQSPSESPKPPVQIQKSQSPLFPSPSLSLSPSPFCSLFYFILFLFLFSSCASPFDCLRTGQFWNLERLFRHFSPFAAHQSSLLLHLLHLHLLVLLLLPLLSLPFPRLLFVFIQCFSRFFFIQSSFWYLLRALSL